jgi:hypothetical protein
MSFWTSIFGGANGTLSNSINQTGSIANQEQGTGSQNLTAGSGFFNSILSGNSSKVASALSPQISSLKTSVNQDQKTASQNNTRSGGTAAGNAAAKDKVHSDITNLTGSLTSGAASTLLNSGQSLLGAATGAYSDQAKLSQDQMSNWANSIFGKSISSGIGAAESFGLGAAAGGIAGTGAAKGGQSAFQSFLDQ